MESIAETTWKFYLSPEEAWDAMFQECARAEHTIDLEQYIFNNDEVGRRFLDLFVKKAAEGVRVRLLFDAAGSLGLFTSRKPQELSERGIAIQFFNPLSLWRMTNFTSWFFRDHRKLLVVDSCAAHTGGVGMNAGMRGWRDTHIRITGPVVGEFEKAFWAMWTAAMTGKYRRKRRPRYNDWNFAYLTNAPWFRHRFMYHALLNALRSARLYAYFTTPYFIPDLKFFRALRRVARRGVDVRLLVAERSDIRMVDLASKSYFSLALRAGVKIFGYKKKILHAKTAVIDDQWATAGSMNLDNLSFLFNHEGNLVSRDSLFIRDIKEQFLADVAAAGEITKEIWHERPMLQKLSEVLTWPLHKFL